MEFKFQRGNQTPVTNKYISSDEKSKQKNTRQGKRIENDGRVES